MSLLLVVFLHSSTLGDNIYKISNLKFPKRSAGIERGVSDPMSIRGHAALSLPTKRLAENPSHVGDAGLNDDVAMVEPKMSNRGWLIPSRRRRSVLCLDKYPGWGEWKYLPCEKNKVVKYDKNTATKYCCDKGYKHCKESRL